MELWMALLAAALGYLLGSISSARLIARRVAPDADIEKIETLIPGTQVVFVSDSVSATAVRMKVGTRYGCLTAILDMLKVAIPVLVLKLWQPEIPYFLFSAAGGLLGHDFPLYHRFKGGRGESPIYGALLVIDPLGVVATTAIGFVIGALSGNLLVLRWAGLVLFMPWLWFRTQDPYHLAYIILANLVYWITMLPELKQYFVLRNTGQEPSQEEIAAEFGMGARLGRFLDRYSLPGLLSKRKVSRS